MQVDVVEPGQYFGLGDLIEPDDREFSLVSEGCEILRIPLR